MIKLEEIHFHDSEILDVFTYPEKREVHYILSYPIDWENNIFERRTIIFSIVSLHEIQERSITGNPTILEVKIDRNDMRTRITFETNAGKRMVEFSDYEFA